MRRRRSSTRIGSSIARKIWWHRKARACCWRVNVNRRRCRRWWRRSMRRWGTWGRRCWGGERRERRRRRSGSCRGRLRIRIKALFIVGGNPILQCAGGSGLGEVAEVGGDGGAAGICRGRDFAAGDVECAADALPASWGDRRFGRELCLGAADDSSALPGRGANWICWRRWRGWRSRPGTGQDTFKEVAKPGDFYAAWASFFTTVSWRTAR